MTERQIEAAHRFRPGICKDCKVSYRDSVFNIEEFMRQNRAGREYLAKKVGTPIEEAEAAGRARHSQWLEAHGYTNCDRQGCKKSIKL